MTATASTQREVDPDAADPDDPDGTEMEGVLTLGVVTGGVEMLGTVPTGVGIGGVVIPGTVTGGTVTVGTVTPGTVTPGTVTPGTVTPDALAARVSMWGTDPDGTEMPGRLIFGRVAALEREPAVSAPSSSATNSLAMRRVRRVIPPENVAAGQNLRIFHPRAPCSLGAMVASYRSVLSVPGSTRMLASALLGRLPQGMSSLAILLLVRGTTRSYAAAGVAVGAYAFASAACAPLQGRLVDRFGRVRVLAPFAVGQAVVLVGLVIGASSGAGAVTLIALAALAGALMPPIAPTVRALMREVWPDQGTRETAYSLDSVVQELVWITGPLLVAVIVGATSPEAAVLVLAAVCLVGTAMFVRSPLARGAGRRDSGDGRRSVFSNPELRSLLGPVALTGMGLGAIEVGLPSLALHAGSRPASGLLLALWSVGSMAGGLWYGSRTWRSPLSSRYRKLLALAVVFTAPLIAAHSIPAGAVCSILAGMMIAPVFASQYALVGRAVTPGSETEAFTWVSAALVSGIALGSALGGASIGSAGVSAPFAISCLASTLAAALAVTLRDRVPQAA